jgi:RHS repeat-associated protein
MQNLTYVYDAVGNVQSVTDGKNSNQIQDFEYDPLDRLTRAETTGGGVSTYDRDYEYNTIGNITTTSNVGTYVYTTTVTGCAGETQTHKPHAVGTAGSNSYGYDCNGNMTSRDEKGVDYIQEFDAENRLVRVTANGETSEFIYDGDGNRVRKIDGDGATAYVGGYYEIDGGNGTQASHGLDFDGTNDHVLIPDSPSNGDFSSQITLEAWIKPDSFNTSNRSCIVTKSSAYYLNLNTTGHLSFYWYDLSTPGYHTSPNVIPTDRWTHVAATYDGSYVRLYENGEQVYSTAVTGSGRKSANQIGIGRHPASSSTRYFDGHIDEVRILNRALSASEVRGDYNARGGYPARTGTVGWYHMDEGTGTSLGDGSGYGNTGTVYGASWSEGSSTSLILGEVGYIDDTLTHTPQTIVLSRSYADPVVFAQPVSRDGGDPSVIRITDVQADRFTLYVHEAPNKNGSHTTEAVSYLVLEAGSWQLPDGTLLEAGKVDTSATVGKNVSNVWEQVSFHQLHSAAPAVVSQVQTENDPHWVKTRQQNTTATGFEVALEEEENETSAHGSETIGWLAIEAGQGSWSDHTYEAANTADAVTHDWYQINFGQSFGAAPRFIAGLATYDGVDNAYLRYSRTSLTTSGVQVMVEEETTYDTETGHTSEVVSYLAIQGDGLLTGRAHLETDYYYAAGARVAMRQGAVVYYLHADHLGSTSLATTYGGQEVTGSRTLYYPYGEQRWSASGGTLPTDFTYTGQRDEAGLGLMDYHARYYDPYIARFISADTIVPNPLDPQLFNRYSYAGNNPVLYNDPDGHGGPLIVLGVAALAIAVWVSMEMEVGEGAQPHDPAAMYWNGVETAVKLGGDTPGDAYALVDEWPENAGTNALALAIPFASAGVLKAGKGALRYADEVVENGVPIGKGIGRWAKNSPGMPEAARAYQEYVTGAARGWEFIRNGVYFDGIRLTETGEAVLLDAKWGDRWYRQVGDLPIAAQDALERAYRQLEAADGLPIEWHVSDPAAERALKQLFYERGISIEVVHTPWTD